MSTEKPESRRLNGTAKLVTVALTTVALVSGGGGMLTGREGNARSIKTEERLVEVEKQFAGLHETVTGLAKTQDKMDAKLDRLLERK